MPMDCSRVVPYCALLLSFLLISSATQPNIVLIFADDLGWGDLSCYGHPTSTTPNLDRMAAEGLRFTQFYSASPVCSPSRAALMTGRYQTRSGIYPGVFGAASVGGLPLNETTIAESLKTVGYSTAIVGKWHLGVGKNFTYLPTNYGFDYYLGIPYSHDMCPCITCFYPNTSCFDLCRTSDVPCPIFENDKIVQQPADFLKLTESYISAATSFIHTKAAAGSPFFLYLAFQHTHHPQFASEKFTNSSIRGTFGDSLNELDWGVGQVFEALRGAGVENNTFVFFTSDNGPSLTREVRGGNAGLLRCGKGTTWEGGQREPAIAWWPGKIRVGTTVELAATVDVFPTIVNLLGVKPPNVTLDGVDMAPILFENKQSNRDFYIYYPENPEPTFGIYAVRWNQYKAHYYSHGPFVFTSNSWNSLRLWIRGQAWDCKDTIGLCPDTYPDEVCRRNFTTHTYNPPLLYDLHSDPSEIYNLNSTEYNDVLEQIAMVKRTFEATMVWGKSQMKRGSDPSVEPCAQPGCSPFPSCCRTNSLSPDTSRVIP